MRDTTLLEIFGVGWFFGNEAPSDALVRALVRSAGRTVSEGEQRYGLLVTPMPSGRSRVAWLCGVLSTDVGVEAAERLGLLGDEAAIPALVAARASSHLAAPARLALARLGRRGPPCAHGEVELLVAALGQGDLPAASGLPEGLVAAVDRGAAGVPGLIEALDVLGPLGREAVARLLAEDTRRGVLGAHLDALLPWVAEEPVFALTLVSVDPQALGERLSAPDWRVRMGAAIVLARHPSGAEASGALRRAIRDDDVDVRREASVASVQLGLSERLEEIGGSIGGFERLVEALQGLEGPGLPAVVGRLVHEPVAGLTEQVLLSLARREPSRWASVFEAVYEDRARDQPLSVRRAGAAASVLGGGRVRQPLLRRLLLSGADGPVPEEVDELWVVALTDADAAVRLAALQLAGRTGPVHASPFLMRMLRDVDADVRAEAERLSGPRWAPSDQLLADVLVRCPGEERASALQRLHVADAPLATGLAEGLLGSGDRGLALAAARIVGASGQQAGERAQWALAELSVGSWIRREAAAVLLGSLSAEGLSMALLDEVLEGLEVALEDDDEDVVRAARWARAQLEGPCA